MKVLILSSNFMAIGAELKETISSLGYETELLIRQHISVGFVSKIKERVRALLYPETIGYNPAEVKQLSKDVLKKLYNDNSIVVIDSLGINLDEETAEKIAKTNVLVKRMGDSILSYKYLQNTLKYYDLVTTYETADIENLHSAGANKVDYICGTYNENLFFPIKKEKDIDICFVGKMFPKEHTHRRKLMEVLVKAFPDLNFAIYGVYAKKYQILRYAKWKIFDNGKYFKNRNINPNEVNELYNRSKICININSFQTINSWSSRLPELLGSGSFVISETTPESVEAFKDCCAWFSNKYELVRQVQMYINDAPKRESISKKGNSLVRHKYTRKMAFMRLMEAIEHIYSEKIVNS